MELSILTAFTTKKSFPLLAGVFVAFFSFQNNQWQLLVNFLLGVLSVSGLMICQERILCLMIFVHILSSLAFKSFLLNRNHKKK